MLVNLFLYFLIYSLIGWVWEVLLTIRFDHVLVNRGFLNGPYCPIYGLGAVMFMWLDQIFGNNLLVLFFVGGTAACTLEYITSWLMELIFHARWWSYEDKAFNINGRVCLRGFIVFGIGAVILHLVHQYIVAFVAGIDQRELVAIILAVVFTVDALVTSLSSARFSRFLKYFEYLSGQNAIIKYTKKGKRKIYTKTTKKPQRVLTYPQRRLIRAFPNYESSFENAYREVKKLAKDTDTKSDKTAHARKKGNKIVK